MNEYKCTDCGGDATVALSNVKQRMANDKYKTIIKGKERLCLKCAAERGIQFFSKKARYEFKESTGHDKR